MATTTPNYGWSVPTSSDYVAQGAVAIETLGDSVDSSLFTINAGSAKVGLHLITTAALTGASVTVSGAFSTTYDSYQIVISNLRTAAVQDTNIRMGTTATGYYGSQIFAGNTYATSSGFAAFANTNNGASIATGIVSSSATTNTSGGVIYVQNPFLTTTTTFQSVGSDPRTDGQGRYTSAFHSTATSFTTFTLLAAGTTFTAGTVRVYGERKS